MKKLTLNISPPGSPLFPQAGTRNPNVGTSGQGLAPMPKRTPPDFHPVAKPKFGMIQGGIARAPKAPKGPKAAGNVQTNSGFFGR